MDEKIVKDLIDRLIDLSFAEDIGDGDHTTLSSIPADAMGKSKLLIKEEGILAGIEIAKMVFHRFDPTMKVEVFIEDGTWVKPGDVAMIVEGKIQSLLQTERLMLNIMQRMSGIATMTNKYVKKLEGTKTRVLDTRKTTPGMRILEKMAVKIGGGCNHRIGLFDMILLKDNHVDFSGSIHNAVTRAKEYCKAKGKDLKLLTKVLTASCSTTSRRKIPRRLWKSWLVVAKPNRRVASLTKPCCRMLRQVSISSRSVH